VRECPRCEGWIEAIEAVSLDEEETERLVAFLAAPAAPRDRLRRVAAPVLGR
jgi:uncharacterized protein (DUF1778 family)